MTVTIRPIQSRDAPRWRDLWDAYARFYQWAPSEALTRNTWQRILDPTSPVRGIVAERDDRVVAMANYLLHDDTWTLTPACCLADLFVEDDGRAQGVGQMLIDWLVAEMKRHGWSSVHWITRETNYRARGLYDKYTPHSGFVRYVIRNVERSLQDGL